MNGSASAPTITPFLRSSTRARARHRARSPTRSATTAASSSGCSTSSSRRDSSNVDATRATAAGTLSASARPARRSLSEIRALADDPRRRVPRPADRRRACPAPRSAPASSRRNTCQTAAPTWLCPPRSPAENTPASNGRSSGRQSVPPAQPRFSARILSRRVTAGTGRLPALPMTDSRCARVSDDRLAQIGSTVTVEAKKASLSTAVTRTRSDLGAPAAESWSASIVISFPYSSGTSVRYRFHELLGLRASLGSTRFTL